MFKQKEFLFQNYVLTKFSGCNVKFLVLKEENKCSKNSWKWWGWSKKCLHNIWMAPQGNDWMPLFSGNIVNPGLPSVQPNELMVTAPDQRSSSWHVFTNFPNMNLRIFSTKCSKKFVLILSNAQNWEKNLFSNFSWMFLNPNDFFQFEF